MTSEAPFSISADSRLLAAHFCASDRLAEHDAAMAAIERSPATRMFQEAIQAYGGVELHRHLEGSLNVYDLWLVVQDLEQTLGLSFDFTKETWIELARIMNGETVDRSKQNAYFPAFLNRLATPGLRTIYEKTILAADRWNEDIDSGMKKGEKRHHLGETSYIIMKAVCRRALDKAYEEGLRVYEMMASPLAMIREGNLLIGAPKEHASIEEFDHVYFEWEQRTQPSELGVKTIDPEQLLSLETYVLAFWGAVAERPDRYVMWGGETEGDTRMKVGIRLCLRREQLPESCLLNIPNPDNPNHQMLSATGVDMIHRMIHLYSAGLITGVNIGGDESKERYLLKNFSVALKMLKQSGVSITVHAGETTDANRHIALKNLIYAIKVLKADRIGHAKQLFDGSPAMNLLLQLMIEHPEEYPSCIEANIFSNFELMLIGKIIEHPILRARGNELFQSPAGMRFLDERIYLSTDDPNLTALGIDMVKVIEGEEMAPIDNRPLAKELAIVALFGTYLDRFEYPVRYMQDAMHRAKHL
ncbi:hypothetical protein HY948_03125 [Candidatus Gottesmanbacteria bacterium]|nr:hypothetical protein [Candidatus Gottesmanbacteria bacterium]